MNFLKVSAMFAAYVWFLNRNKGTAAAEKEAVLFARYNWQAFLPCVHKGLGRLLIRIAGGPHRRRRCGWRKGAVIAG